MQVAAQYLSDIQPLMDAAPMLASICAKNRWQAWNTERQAVQVQRMLRSFGHAMGPVKDAACIGIAIAAWTISGVAAATIQPNRACCK